MSSVILKSELPGFYQVLERDSVAEQFDKANADFERTLDSLPYDQFASDEVREQVRTEVCRWW